MINYITWKSNEDNGLYIEILNECDIPEIQKKFIDEGYIIWKCTFMGEHCWMYITKGEE